MPAAVMTCFATYSVSVSVLPATSQTSKCQNVQNFRNKKPHNPFKLQTMSTASVSEPEKLTNVHEVQPAHVFFGLLSPQTRQCLQKLGSLKTSVCRKCSLFH